MTDAQAKQAGIRAVRRQPEVVKTALVAEWQAGLSKVTRESLSMVEIPERMTEMCKESVKKLRRLGFKTNWNLVGHWWYEWLNS